MNIITISTHFDPKDVADLISPWGVVIAPTPIPDPWPPAPAPAIPAGYEIRQVGWGYDQREPSYAPGDKLWVIVPEGYPTLHMIFFRKIGRSYVFGQGDTADWRDDLAIPYQFATNPEDAIRDLVPDLVQYPEDYIF